MNINNDEILHFIMQKKQSCIFTYSAINNEMHYTANFEYERLFAPHAPNPLAAMLMGEMLFEGSKPYISELNAKLFLSPEPKKNEFIEHIIELCIENKKVPFLLSMSITCNNDIDCTDGKFSKIIGQVSSIESISGNLNQASSVPRPKVQFPAEQVMSEMSKAENYAIIQFDICRFKLINEAHGEEIGDKVLENIRTRLPDVWGRHAVTCRLGADIFCIFSEYDSTDEIEERIANIQQQLQHYENIQYKFSFGIYIVDDRTIPLRKMTDFAGIGRRRDRDVTTNHIKYYQQSYSKELNNRHEVESEMETALASGQFEVYLQPKCRIDDGKICGAEALVRWRHPIKGIIPPNQFIPVFEENRYIEKVDNFVHREVCRLLKKWIDSGVTPLPISVNVSQVYVGTPDLAKKIKKIVDDFSVPIELFQLEITESYENHCVDATVSQMKELGFTLLMDDFGAGYSSLNTLRTTKFDILKLDREFLSDYIVDDRGQKIVNHTIAMANDIGLDVIAEGVETNEQAILLNSNGCGIAQGFLYSRPVPVAEFEEMLFGRQI